MTQTSTPLSSERGIALITTLLVMMLMSALMIGFTSAVTSDQRYRFMDRDRAQAFYAAQSGLEKLNGELADLFFTKVAPTAADIAGLANNPPVIPGITFAAAGGGSGYTVTRLASSSAPITTGPYQGLIALKTGYNLDASVHTGAGGEAHLTRRLDTVAIPVFQFGMFSDVDLSFSAADEFDFGGRVHTNGNLFLAQGGGAGDTLWLKDRVTAVREIVRQRLSNGVSIDNSGSTRTVKVATAPGVYRTLARPEGSVVDGPASAQNNAWTTISLSTYNSYIRNGRTGARALNLPLITSGGINFDLVRRPVDDEDVTNAGLLAARYFSRTSLRILLSDTAADILNLPGVTGTAPVALDGNWLAAPPAGYGPVNASHPPIARSPGDATGVNAAAVAAGGNQTITLTANVPAYFKTTAYRLVKAGFAPVNVACTSKTALTLTTCGVKPVDYDATWSIEADVAVAPGEVVTVTRPLTAMWVKNTTTITLGNAGFPTAPFAPNTFWVHNANGGSILVTCTGYNAATRFTGCNVPTPLSANAAVTTAALSNAGVGTLGGFIKIEMQDANNVWTDVTLQILNWGIGSANLDGRPCADPTPNAIVRLQRLRDNNEPGNAACTYQGSTRSTDYWPNALFDTREAFYRDDAPSALPRLGGVMHYVALDVANLSKWFAARAPYGGSPGPTAISDNGYSVYFSDRRNNRDAAGEETGEYGFEDFVNPLSGNAIANGALDAGEDVNGNGTLETYGQFPAYQGVWKAVPDGALAPLNANARPWTDVRASQARVNRAVLFRRALKLVNGGLGNIVTPGFTVASENPVYVQGHWNADQNGFGGAACIDVNNAAGCHAATSIVADAVTMLSSAWNDNNAFDAPYDAGARPRNSDTYYRVAIIAGKGRIFPNPPNEGATFGTDGGAHSFLRFLEGAGPGNNEVHYRGSLVTFYYNRQAVSPFRCCNGHTYDVPRRDYIFDTDFLDPAKLPPLTPVFRDVNSLGFTQENRPGR